MTGTVRSIAGGGRDVASMGSRVYKVAILVGKLDVFSEKN
jgi:hypothetical protein